MQRKPFPPPTMSHHRAKRPPRSAGKVPSFVYRQEVFELSINHAASIPPQSRKQSPQPSFRTITAPQTLRGRAADTSGDVALSVRFPAARKEALSRVLHPALLTHFGDVVLSVRPSAPPQHTGYLLRATGMELFLTFSPNSSMRPLTKRHWASSRRLSGHLTLRPRSDR